MKNKKSEIIVPVIVFVLIFAVLSAFTYIQRVRVIDKAEQVVNQMAEYIAVNIANEIDYAQSSIKLSAVTVSQTMTSDTIENPSDVISPMVDNTPFGAIEYIRADGMNVMNIGEPFDASDREYYIEGIKGNTGIWNNYHPKTSQETLMNFYTPLMYNGQITGVITGYIQATKQISPLFETKLYGQDIYGVVVDENDMVICSTIDDEFEPDLKLSVFLDRFPLSDEKKDDLIDIINDATDVATTYKESAGEGRVCTVAIPGTQWKVAVIIPASSIRAITTSNTRLSIYAIVAIGLILVAYIFFVSWQNSKRRREIVDEKNRLQEMNRLADQENKKAFDEIAEIRDIIASANMGTWRIELVDGEDPRMYVDNTMKKLLGLADEDLTPEETYAEWFSNIKPEAVPSVLKSVDRMKDGFYDENTYLWINPVTGPRYVRCGGTAQRIIGGYALRGYHYDVDEVVREDEAKVVMLRDALENNKEYYSTLGSIGSIFNSMHVIDLTDDTVVEFSARKEVSDIVNHRDGAGDMMIQVMSALTTDEYREEALNFTDLSTVADRMINKKMISKQLISKQIGWFVASFITMEMDDDGRPTKVVYTTRSIDEEKKQEEKLIHKSQTDELTGMFNRRAYEEDIYEHNDTPEEDYFIYMSLDVNGLKIINDTLGHAAGDELIRGACQCMKTSLGMFGKIYRTGGDEFVAILFCDEEKLKEVLANFEDKIASWSGDLVESLSISYGWVSKEEMPELTVRKMGVIADQRMYEAKSAHYRKAGVDRRGQQDAHKALCELYTKILKINITDDTYQIVNMDTAEQTVEKGFAEKISEWLASFGKSGQVHPDDLEGYLRETDLQYMRDYFAGDKTSLNIFYRRKYEDGFKQVMMEMIPANDYSADNQSLFLYVKNIDK